MTRPRPRLTGEWCAYVAAGIDRPEREERLSEVPEAMRREVLNHARTVYALREKARAKKNLSTEAKTKNLYYQERKQ